MQKRGQITLFIIAGIILLLIIFLFFYLRGQINIPQIETIDPEIRSIREEVRLSINDCLQEASESAVYTFGLTGVKQDLKTVYPIYNRDNVPNNREIEGFLNKYISLVSLCENNYINRTLDVKSKSKIKQDFVSSTIDYPVIVEYKDRTTRIDDSYNIEVPIRIGYLMNVVNELINSYFGNNKKVDMNLLSSYDLDISTFATNQYLVYVIQDSSIKDDSFILMFGVEL